MSDDVLVSVVVPTYRRPKLLRGCLAALAAQDLDRGSYEVLVVDDASGRDTDFGDLGSAGQVRWFTQPSNRGPAAARNRGVAEARGRIILFVDDDVVPSSSLVRTHLELHRDGDYRCGFVGGVEWHPSLTVTPFMRWLDTTDLQFAFRTWMREGPVDRPWEAFYTCNLSMTAQMFTEAGGFDERFPYPAFEDIELGVRLARKGFRLEYHPTALVWNARAVTLKDFCERTELVAASAALLRAAQPDLPFELPEVNPGEPKAISRLALHLLPLAAATIPSMYLRGRRYRAEIHRAYRRGARTARDTRSGGDDGG